MKKIIEYGYFRAVVDASNLDDVKISITTAKPIEVSDYYANNDVWRWERDIALDAQMLRAEIDAYKQSVHMERRREKLCAAS